MKYKVHMEPQDMRSSPPENCVDCRQPTRTWLDPHTPLCVDCCKERNEREKTPTKAFLVLVTWPDGREGLLFPRPGHVPIATTKEQGEEDFKTAVNHMEEYIFMLHPMAEELMANCRGATLRLVEFQRSRTLKAYQYERDHREDA